MIEINGETIKIKESTSKGFVEIDISKQKERKKERGGVDC